MREVQRVAAVAVEDHLVHRLGGRGAAARTSRAGRGGRGPGSRRCPRSGRALSLEETLRLVDAPQGDPAVEVVGAARSSTSAEPASNAENITRPHVSGRCMSITPWGDHTQLFSASGLPVCGSTSLTYVPAVHVRTPLDAREVHPPAVARSRRAAARPAASRERRATGWRSRRSSRGRGPTGR